MRLVRLGFGLGFGGFYGSSVVYAFKENIPLSLAFFIIGTWFAICYLVLWIKECSK